MLIYSTGETPSRWFFFVRHGEKDSKGNLTPHGRDQASALGVLLSQRNLGPFGWRIHSPIPRTRHTLLAISAVMGLDNVPIAECSALFDSRALHEQNLIDRRQELYGMLQESPLAAFRQSPSNRAAMDELGHHFRLTIQKNAMWDNSGNCLAVGHGVYLNQGILSTFGHQMPDDMIDELLKSDCLEVAEGYLIGVNKSWAPIHMERISWRNAALK